MSQELEIFRTPGGSSAVRLPGGRMPQPQTDSQLLKHIADKLDELVSRTAKVEKELLGSEADRSGGLVFRLAKAEQQIAIMWAVHAIAGATIVGLLITKLMNGS